MSPHRPATHRAVRFLVGVCALFAPACGNSLEPRGSSTNAGGAAGASGASGSSGVAGSSGLAGASGLGGGGASGAAGASGGGGVAGVSGSAGASGASGSGGSALHGGASARFVCPTGMSFGDPLAGMGPVNTISAPTTGPVTYFAFIEGPVWVGSLGKLFFSDNVMPERIWQVTPPSTTPSVFMEMSGSNGLALDNDDQLLLADQANHRIARLDPTSTTPSATPVLSGNFTPNDLIVRSDGNLYFTDPNSAGRGFYRISPAGALTGPFTRVGAPNGITLSLDENTLYVGDVNSRMVWSFALASDGSVDEASGATYVTVANNVLDGMALDCAGNLYASTQGGVEVWSPSRTALGTIPTGEASNATFGGADRKTLYVTSRSQLKSVSLAVPGLPD